MKTYNLATLEKARDRVKQFDDEFEKLSCDHLPKPVFSWRKFRIVCPYCGEVMKLKRRYFTKNVGEDIIEFKSKIVIGNHDQIFYCAKCGFRQCYECFRLGV